MCCCRGAQFVSAQERAWGVSLGSFPHQYESHSGNPPPVRKRHGIRLHSRKGAVDGVQEGESREGSASRLSQEQIQTSFGNSPAVTP